VTLTRVLFTVTNVLYYRKLFGAQCPFFSGTGHRL
jgi:hypothetical protein